MNAETAADDSIVALEPEVLLDLHRRMVRIRLFEEEAGKLMEGGRMPGFLHLYVGQEAVAAGVMATLRPDDVITSTHRGHGHAVAKGADLRYMYAELFGKTTGYCKGRGGSMHINDLSIGMLGANGIVGGGIPHAVGAAFAAVYKGQDSVAVPFFGDGATNIGAFHESANLAAVMHLPVVFVCENNGYSEFTPQERHMLLKDVADRAAAYGMPGEIVDGMDAVAVYLAARRLCSRPRPTGITTIKVSRACASRTARRRRSTPGRNGTRSPRSSSGWPARRWLLKRAWTRSGPTRARRSPPRSSSPSRARILTRRTCSITSIRCEDASARDQLRKGLHRVAHAADGRGR
jgi:pyruvate dehydrogenase E1 component alpha subunit